jgi:hypothetical protein
MTRTSADAPDFVPVLAQLALAGDHVKGDQLSSVLSLMNELLPDLSAEARADRHRVPNSTSMASTAIIGGLSPNPTSPPSAANSPGDGHDDAIVEHEPVAVSGTSTQSSLSPPMLASAGSMLSSSAPVSSSTSPSMSTGITSPFAPQQSIPVSIPVMFSGSSSPHLASSSSTSSPPLMPPLNVAATTTASISSRPVTPPPSVAQTTLRSDSPSSPFRPTRLVFSTPSVGAGVPVQPSVIAAAGSSPALSSIPAPSATGLALPSLTILSTTPPKPTSGSSNTIPSLSSTAPLPPAAATVLVSTSPIPKVAPPSSSELMRRAKVAFLAAHPDIHLSIGRYFVPVFLKACNNTANPTIKYKCLSGVLRILWATPAEMMTSFLPGSDLCSFIAALLQTKDYPVMSSALQIAELLLAKLASQYHDQFIREGVVDVIREYCISVTTSSGMTPTSTKPELSKQMSPYLRPMISETQAAVRNRARALLQTYFKDVSSLL